MSYPGAAVDGEAVVCNRVEPVKRCMSPVVSKTSMSRRCWQEGDTVRVDGKKPLVLLLVEGMPTSSTIVVGDEPLDLHVGDELLALEQTVAHTTRVEALDRCARR